MSQNRARLRRLVHEVLAGGNLDLVDELVHEKFVEYGSFPLQIPDGREGLKAWIATLHQGFSDIGAEIEDLVEDGDTVWARVRIHGIHTGEFLGIPPTDKPFEINTLDVIRFQDDKAVERWGVTDTTSLLIQLGVMRRPAA